MTFWIFYRARSIPNFGIDLANVWDAYVHFVPDVLPKLQALDAYIQMRKILG